MRKLLFSNVKTEAKEQKRINKMKYLFVWPCIGMLKKTGYKILVANLMFD